MTDVRDILFREIAEKKFRAVLTAERSGVFCGKSAAITCAQALGIELEICKNDGDELSHGQRVCQFVGKAKAGSDSRRATHRHDGKSLWHCYGGEDSGSLSRR